MAVGESLSRLGTAIACCGVAGVVDCGRPVDEVTENSGLTAFFVSYKSGPAALAFLTSTPISFFNCFFALSGKAA
jgi:hypothetical protein